MGKQWLRPVLGGLFGPAVVSAGWGRGGWSVWAGNSCHVFGLPGALFRACGWPALEVTGRDLLDCLVSKVLPKQCVLKVAARRVQLLLSMLPKALVDLFADGRLGSDSPFAGACSVPRPRTTCPFLGCDQLGPGGLAPLQMRDFFRNDAQPFRNHGSGPIKERVLGGFSERVPLVWPRRHGHCSGPLSGREGFQVRREDLLRWLGCVRRSTLGGGEGARLEFRIRNVPTGRAPTSF